MLPYYMKYSSVCLNPLYWFHDAINDSLFGNSCLWVSISLCLSSRGADFLFKNAILSRMFVQQTALKDRDGVFLQRKRQVFFLHIKIKIIAGRVTASYKSFRVPKLKVLLLWTLLVSLCGKWGLRNRDQCWLWKAQLPCLWARSLVSSAMKPVG